MAQRITMSQREYARQRGVHLRAIQDAIAAGTIRPVDGRIDPLQADASWGVIRRARTSVQDDDAGQRSARSKVAVALAKLRLMRQQYEALLDRYADRSEAIEVAGNEAAYVMAALSGVPERDADQLAAELSVEPAVATKILGNFIDLVLGELGDLRQQAIRDAERTV